MLEYLFMAVFGYAGWQDRQTKHSEDIFLSLAYMLFMFWNSEMGGTAVAPGIAMVTFSGLYFLNSFCARLWGRPLCAWTDVLAAPLLFGAGALLNPDAGSLIFSEVSFILTLLYFFYKDRGERKHPLVWYMFVSLVLTFLLLAARGLLIKQIGIMEQAI